MIFSGDLFGKVLDGTKTQTRRPARTYLNGDPDPCRYLVGRTYAIQRKRGEPGVGPRILVTSVELVRTFPISHADAQAEGFDSADDFFERWHSFYGVGGEPWCWRIEFRLAEANDV